MKMKPEDLSKASKLIAEEIAAEDHGAYEPSNSYPTPDFSAEIPVLKQHMFARWIGRCLDQVKAGQVIRIRRGDSVFEVSLYSVDKAYIVKEASKDVPPSTRGGWRPGDGRVNGPHKSVLPENLRGDND